MNKSRLTQLELPDQLVFGRRLPREARKDFVFISDKDAIDRIQLASWISFIVYLLLFIVDFKRQSSILDVYDARVFQLLHYVHICGFLFLALAIPTTVWNTGIKASRLFRGITIYSFLAIVIFAVYTNAVLSLWSTSSLVLYVGYIMVANWALPMNYFQSMLFNSVSAGLMIYFVYNPVGDLHTYQINQDETVYRVLKVFEIAFTTLIALLFAMFDMRLRLDRYLANIELRHEKKRIEQLEQSKSRLYANISHEFRSPLTIISGTTNQMINSPDRISSNKLASIQRNSARLLNLVNQMLDLSKLDSGNLKLKNVYGDVVPYLRYIEDCFSEHAASRGVSLHIICEELVIFMDYDPDVLLSVFSNLVANAIKFTPEGGNVYINVRIEHGARESFLQVKVRDTGKGIDPHELPYIFDRFYTGDPQKSQIGVGTGIGLAMVKELAKLVHGNIHVSSQPGIGTEFTFLYPINHNPAVEASSSWGDTVRKTAEAYLGTPVENFEFWKSNGLSNSELPTLVIVDDNPELLQFIESCLKDDFNVRSCTDGRQGLELALEITPDIIVTDVVMPVMDGLEMCRQLRTDKATSHIPLVILSARTEVEDKIEGLASGAVEYLTKPFDEQELKMHLFNLIDLVREQQARYSNPETFGEIGEESPEDSFIKQVHEIVIEHLDDTELNVLELCRALGMSRTQLHNKLKALTGMSTTIFIRSIRLTEAKKLLQKTDLNISEIAYDVGFGDPSYFTRVFTEETGYSPTRFREKLASTSA